MTMLPMSQATSPFRFATPESSRTRTSDLLSNVRVRRMSTQSTSKSNGKGRGSVGSVDSHTAADDAQSFSNRYAVPSDLHQPRNSAEHAQDLSGMPKRARGSILLAASDAMHFKFGRKRKSVRQPEPMSVVLPDVLEISAGRRDEEMEERERLRDVAAQSIGLGHGLLQDQNSIQESAEDDFSEEQVDELESTDAPEHLPLPRPVDLGYSSASLPQAQNGRHRAGSLAHSVAHSRRHSRSITPVPLPAFPATHVVLAPLLQISATLPKYYPPSSLRIFALSKQWKARFMALSSPTVNTSRTSSGPVVSYLHLFKSSALEEKELERLEINEESVVFVPEEEAGGRNSVVKVGGIDVGALKKDLNHEEGGRTIWLLQILDPNEAQRWIGAIKNAILGQRSMRAGLGIPATIGGIEPHGDMDVMLSMRAQGLVSSPTQAKFNLPELAAARSPTGTISASQEQNGSVDTTSSQSGRSLSLSSKAPQPNAVSTLKGLFAGGGRPRSPSRSTAASAEDDEDTAPEDSFGHMGTSLLTMLRANGTADASASTSTPGPSTPLATPRTPSTVPRLSVISTASNSGLDRKIIADGGPVDWSPADTSARDRVGRTLSVSSLHPPPRKRPWTSSVQQPAESEEQRRYTHHHGNGSITDSFGVGAIHESSSRPPASPSSTGRSSSTSDQRARAASVKSVSTYASAENGSIERSNSTKKRWSRQVALLPKRLTPPSGPPPSVPETEVQVQLPSPTDLTPRGQSMQQNQHPYNAESQSRSRSSSVPSNASNASSRGLVGSLSTFSKRASGSSAFSYSSVSSAHSQSRTNSSGHRSSIPPPPRPVPTFAPPPIPQEAPRSPSPKQRPDSPPTKSPSSSFRDSVKHRALRFSASPKPPPSSTLPPRPDDPEFKSHRRSHSGGVNTPPHLYSIPASPVPSTHPLPPPTGPLPPVPVSRHTSIKQRLRILSAPSPIIPPPSGSPLTGRSSSPHPSSINPYSPPSTPIGERITRQQNDPNFLQMYSPGTPILPVNLPPSPINHEGTEVTPLSPPPRRGSTMTVPDREPHSSLCEDAYDQQLPPSLSRRGSLVSIGFGI
ncbi:hypothetical protein PLICRDRAFT_43566 [Plicaturopsis crispa FD-325 SS-3]|nr:hypothetical protein PLICRDRAFT_43566 [Plicaturopsis crispa FD-325 SS-3]